MRPISRHFGEVHGVDISDEMIRLARQRLRETPNAHPHHIPNSDLSLFPDGKFDFVYSYAVFQHIPSAEVVFSYLRETVRVLKPGGALLIANLNSFNTACSGWVKGDAGERLYFPIDNYLQERSIWIEYRGIRLNVPGIRP